MSNGRKITIVGAGQVAQAVVAGVPSTWEVVLVDINADALAGFPERVGGVLSRVHGDGTSRLVLERCGLGREAVVVGATESDAANKEVARMAREAFGVQERVVLLKEAAGLEEAGLLRTEVVARHHAAATRVLNTLPIGEARATGIGLGEGELLQVTVLEGSPVIGRELRSIAAREWLVAAVYRGSALIVPHGETVVLSGDRILLVGDPNELRLIAAYFRGGEPTFPTLYGSYVGWFGEDVAPFARWLAEHTLAERAVELPPTWLSADRTSAVKGPGLGEDREIGCLVVPPTPVPWLARVGFRRPARANLMFSLGLPFVVARGAPPIKRLLIALCPNQGPQPLGDVGIDLARELGASLACLTVLPPRVAEGESTVELAGPRQLARLATLHGVALEQIVDEGNPIDRIRHHAKSTDLLIVGYTRRARRNTVFSPDVSLFLLHDAPVSVLFVPRSDR